jgi:hypothetical protein
MILSQILQEASGKIRFPPSAEGMMCSSPNLLTPLAIWFRRSRCNVVPTGKNDLARHPILNISNDEASLKSSAKNVARTLKNIAPKDFAAQSQMRPKEAIALAC